MKLKNGAEYIESLRQLHPRIYYKGKKIEDVTRHPATAPHVRAAAMTYALANDKDFTGQEKIGFLDHRFSMSSFLVTLSSIQ